MRSRRCTRLGLLVGASLAVASCGTGHASVDRQDVAASLRRLPGSTQVAVDLSVSAATRLGIRTELVRGALVPPRPAPPSPFGAPASPPPVLARVVPFAAVLYLPGGQAYVYTNPRPLEYVRAALVVDYVTGSLAVMASGPDLDTRVVTVGATELSGVELGAGE